MRFGWSQERTAGLAEGAMPPSGEPIQGFDGREGVAALGEEITV